MNEYLLIISDLFLPLLQLLVIQKCMNAFLGFGNKGFAGYIGWTAYYIFLVASNLGIISSSSFLLLGNIMLVFIISSVTKRKKLKQRCIFSLAICTIWMLVEVSMGVIKLEVSYIKKMLQICICNSCMTKYRKDATGKYLTTKPNSRNHGIGLTSVEQAISHYHGEALITETGDKFTVTVIMYANDREK